MMDECSKKEVAPEKGFFATKQARKLQATLEGCNPKLSLTDSLTGVKCRATSVAKNDVVDQRPNLNSCV